jgi:F-type H+-transporting ATPase subunit b
MLEFNATFLIAMFSFVVFIFIMNAIFYKPILSIIRKREEYISSNYEDSKRFDETTKEYQDTRSAKIEQTQSRCKHEIKKAIGEAHNLANSKIDEAREVSKNNIRQKKENLYNESETLKAEIQESVVKDLAESITSKIMEVKN